MVLAQSIVVRNSHLGGGRGLFTTEPIARGAMVWAEDAEGEAGWLSTPRSLAWIEALPQAPSVPSGTHTSSLQQLPRSWL